MRPPFLLVGLALFTLLRFGVGTACADDAAGLAAFRNGAFAEAYQAWSAAAQAGDARAARFLGVMYDTGEGVRQDPVEALQWYRRAADLGDRVGMFNVAVSCDAGTAGRQDKAEAAQWYARAAARHHGRAEYNLALMYEAGDGVRRSHVKAIRLFTAAERDGISAAASHLPAQGRVTVGAPPPVEDTEFLQAQRALLSRDPQETATAITLFRQIAAGGGAAAPMARYDLGWCYENGVGVGADRDQAYILYLQAARQTDDPGLRALAQSTALGLHAPPPTTSPH